MSVTDPDGLPLPDQATFNALRSESGALTARPKASEWADLVAMLRWAAEVRRRGEDADNVPQGVTAARLALKAVIQFLQRECVLKHGASMPLIELQAALTDLTNGRVSQMFKPVAKPSGNPGKSRSDAAFMGNSARAMSLLMEAGKSEKDAASRVGKVLGIEPSQVKNWRDRLNQGPGPGAPRAAIDHYKARLPTWPDSTPLQQGERLLKVIKATLVKPSSR
jgi:hypothetical protein